MTTPIDQPAQFDGEAIYKIVVQGLIPENWRDRLAGMQVILNDQQPAQESTQQSTQQLAQKPLSVLQGTIKDQAELNGVFETLYRLQVSIISVEKLSVPE